MTRTMLAAAIVTGLSILSGCRVATLGLTESAISTGDGLGLKFDLTGKVVAVTLDKRELPAGLARIVVPGGFYMHSPGGGNVEILGSARRTDTGVFVTASPAGLDLRAVFVPTADRIEVVGRVTNSSTSARGVTIGLCLPVQAEGWRFGRSILDSDLIRGGGTFAEWTCADSNWDGRQINRGMITPIYSEATGLALGARSDNPEIFRVSYKRGRGFSIEVDLGFSPLPEKFPNTATFRFVIYRFDPRLRYRGALAKYYGMFPRDYEARACEAPNAPADLNASPVCHAVPTPGLPATSQPASPGFVRRATNLHWTAQPASSPASAERGRCAYGPDGQLRVLGMTGGRALLAMNPDIELAQPSLIGKDLAAVLAPDAKTPNISLGPWDEPAGRYLDNYRLAHLATADYPLTYSHGTGQPVQFHAFMWQELARPLADYLHSRAGWLAVEDRPWRMSSMFDQAIVDVHVAADQPERDLDALAYQRSLVGAKLIAGIPVAVAQLEKTKPSARQAAQVERDLGPLLLYGVCPGGAIPQSYMAKTSRAIQATAAAGWQPITGAVVVHPDLLVERFGGPTSTNVFYAVYNRSEIPVAYEMAIDLALVGIDPKTVAVVDRLSGQSPEAVTMVNSLVLRAPVAGRSANLFELSRTGGSVPADTEMKLAISPLKSAVRPLAEFEPRKSASKAFAGTLAKLDLAGRPRSAERFLDAYAKEKRELANAVAFHLRREGTKTGLDAAATELANWLAPQFDGFYRAVLPASAMETWAALRPGSPLVARARVAGESFEVEVIDPLLEK